MASIINVDKIRATGSTNDGLTVSTAGDLALPGTVTMASQPRFQVKGNNGNYITTTPVPFPVVDIDTANGWNTSNNRYVVQKAGTYFFCANIGICRVTSNDGYSYPGILKNGSVIAYVYNQMASATSYTSGDVSVVVDAAVNDYFEVKFWASGGDYYNNTQECRFMGYMLG